MLDVEVDERAPPAPGAPPPLVVDELPDAPVPVPLLPPQETATTIAVLQAISPMISLLRMSFTSLLE
jgi:hypothetical protein